MPVYNMPGYKSFIFFLVYTPVLLSFFGTGYYYPFLFIPEGFDLFHSWSTHNNRILSAFRVPLNPPTGGGGASSLHGRIFKKWVNWQVPKFGYLALFTNSITNYTGAGFAHMCIAGFSLYLCIIIHEKPLVIESPPYCSLIKTWLLHDAQCSNLC